MTATPLPPIDPEASIPDRFAAAVRAFPTRLAVRGRAASWTYAELDALSARIAAALLDRALDGGRPVLLLMANDSPLLAAMLGVLKAGLFYAPVDAGFEPAAAARLADLAAPSLVVADRGLLAAARTLVPGAAVVELDELAAAGGAASRPAPRLPPVPAAAFAYLLFTSGSTGTPKGILQTHRNVLANVARLGAGLRVVPGDRITLLASASHGASVSDIYGALLHGAAVLPFAPRAVSPAAWRDWAAAERITIWHSVPGLFRSLARAVAAGGELPALRLCKLGGEPVFATDLELWKRRFREGGVFHVGLGMTEMNVVCQWFADHQTACPGPVAPVGRPAAGIGAVLLGQDGEPAAAADDAGEGELGIVATTLPVAYWRRPDLTAQAFQPVPATVLAAAAPSAAARRTVRLFRTGDLVRRLPTGELLHLGRRDRQLKIRGLRVDAAEVEAALRGLPGVRDAAVDARPAHGPERQLVAWVVTDAAPAALRAGLAAVLPAEAVPTHFLTVSELPTSGPGKIARDRLPDPPGRPAAPASSQPNPANPENCLAAASDRLPDPPGDPAVPSALLPDSPGGLPAPAAPAVTDHAVARETQVAAALAAVLGLPAVGALDDFFALGGTSLTALDALLGVEQATGCAADMALFLEDPTPRGIARRLGGGRELLTQLAAHRASPAAGGGGPVFWVPAHGAGEGPDLLQLARLARLARLAGPSLVLRLPTELPPTSEALLDCWSAAVLARQRQGPWRLVAACAGGPLGFALAGRLSVHGEVLLVLHDAQFPGRARRWRRLLRRLREPWGDDLLARLRHHLVELSRRRVAAALGYAAGRARSAARGWQRMATPAQQRLSARQQTYLRLSLECRLVPWPGEALLVVTPARRTQQLPELWRRLSPRLAVSLTGADTETESATAIRDFFARTEPPPDAAV
ncbi:MAG TPA: AMP-binding protein [Thermoanaerobaculia bacterium]|nr:AMP-binding protein [Thermoanaerobaculia bacterium]